MTVLVRIPEALRRYSEGKGEVRAEGGTVRAALESLFARHPDLRPRVLDGSGRLRPYLLLFIGGAPATLDTALAAGAILDLVAAAEGG